MQDEMKLLQLNFEKYVNNVPAFIKGILQLTNPALSECGHFVEDGSRMCGACDESIDYHSLLSDPNIKAAAQDFIQFQAKVISQAKEFSDIDFLKQRIKYYDIDASPYLTVFPNTVAIAKVRYRRLLTAFIDECKQNIKIDLRNRQHLEYWHNKTDHGLLGLGGVAVNYKNETFRIPRRIYQMMLAIREKHQTKSEVIQALDMARNLKPTFFNRLFSCVVNRNESTTTVYEHSDLERLRMS